MSEDPVNTNSRLVEEYVRKTPTSRELYQKARGLFPSGVTHDSRYLLPHPIFVSRADGAYKWDVDGNEYLDYFAGHGALLLGHNHPTVTEAVREQLSRGVHFAASHELELEWAALIQKLIPCAERVRFTVTGTEATLLAFRVARAYTGKNIVVRFAGHFHGWQDHVAFSDASGAPGIVKGIVDSVVICPPGDLEFVKRVCESRDDVAAIILEPTGASFGKVPIDPQFLRDLRSLTTRLGILLIFDEVITGFRCSPGGAQGFYQVTPDLTTLAKVMAGGYPGGALVGRAEIMHVMDFKRGNGIVPPAVPHQGTYNAETVSARAGIVTLKIVSTSDAIATANRTAACLRDELNAILRRMGSSWCVYGNFSNFHIFANPDNEPVGPEDIMAGKVPWQKLKKLSGGDDLPNLIRTGFLCGGVDIAGWPGGLLTCRHTLQDVDQTAAAFEKLLKMLAEEGRLA
jgi:glutamate-1-semialdehyde 2,1-aminomutase